MSLKVLVVDDLPSVVEMVCILLERNGFETLGAESGEQALARLAREPVDLVLTDLRLPGMSGIELIQQIRALPGPNSEVPVVMLTGVGRTQEAMEAVRLGADDFLRKPFNNEELLFTLRRALDRRALSEENRRLHGELLERYGLSGLVGTSPAMQEVRDMVRRVKDSRVSVLILGESGTGKERVARAIHYSGSRASKPFVAVNCGAIPENLFESELFGHKKGAFTGATANKIGYFQAAEGGTLFLDDVADMPLSTQLKLLRALAERKVVPVGGVEELPVDVRVIAATNKSPEEEIKAGRFREDLYYRLNVVRIELPPLRKREWDLLVLARHFVREFALEYQKPIRDLDPDATERVLGYPWPGNVRELRNAMEAAVALEELHTVTARSLPRSIGGGAEHTPTYVSAAAPAPPELPEDGVNLESILVDIEREYLNAALRRTGGNKTRAAELLGLSFRSFRYRLARFQLDGAR